MPAGGKSRRNGPEGVRHIRSGVGSQRSNPPKADHRLAVGAAALAFAPIGFALGGIAASRVLAVDAAAGGQLAAACLLGAALAAALAAGVAKRLARKPLRVVTVVAGGVSFALVIYLAQDFVAERLRGAEAFDAAYARMTPFQLRVEANNGNRRPFSALKFDSATRAYAARRPGGWLCRGTGGRDHALGLSLRVRGIEGDRSANCDVRLAWRYGAFADGLAEAEQAPFEHSACAPDALLRVADAMVERTARRASCRRL